MRKDERDNYCTKEGYLGLHTLILKDGNAQKLVYLPTNINVT
jgi:hypothetical protein